MNYYECNISPQGAEHGLRLTLNIERAEDMVGPVSGIGVLVRFIRHCLIFQYTSWINGIRYNHTLSLV